MLPRLPGICQTLASTWQLRNLETGRQLHHMETLNSDGLNLDRQKRTIIVYCHRFFEFRFMIVSKLLEHISKRANLVIFLPEDMIEGFQPYIPENAKVIAAHYHRGPAKTFRHRILSLIDTIFYFTFAHTDKLPNATAEFHRTHHLRWAAKSAWTSRLGALMKVSASRLCSRSKIMRRVLQKIYYKLAVKNLHFSIIESLKPDLMVGCSFGMGLADGGFLIEAHAMGVPTVVLVQSWDRTSNKGYPTVHPDYAIVWNEIMRRECEINLEFSKNSIFVDGAPLWDRHFKKTNLLTQSAWRDQLGIGEKTKVLFYACGGFASHPANMEVIPHIFSLAVEQPFEEKIHVVFRLYPQYYAQVTEQKDATKKRSEIENLLNKYAGVKNISITKPNVAFDGVNFMPSDGDQKFMLSCLKYCDVSLSQVSSQMIEACIFDKPAINIAFGRRRSEKYDISIGDYLTQHLLRVYGTGAIYQARGPNELKGLVGQAMSNPDALGGERQILLDQEAPINRGNAAAAVAERLQTLADQSTTNEPIHKGLKTKSALRQGAY